MLRYGIGSVQEHRGMPPIPRERTKLYSADSYAAQYGITVEDAEDIRERSDTHQQAERQIFAMYKADPDLKARALMRDETEPLTEEEKTKLARSGVDMGEITAAKEMPF